MDNIYSKYIIPIQPEKKQSSSPNSQVGFNNIQQLLEDYSPSNRKLSFSEYKSQELKESQQLSSQNKLSQDFQSEFANSQIKKDQISIDMNKKEQQEFQFLKDDQLLQTNTIIESPTKINGDDSPKKNKFKAFGNLLLSIRRMQQNIVEHISNLDQLKETMIQPSTNMNVSKIHPEPSSRDYENVNDILSNLKLVDRFIYYSEQGSQKDIQNMIKLLKMYPKKHLYCPTDPKHILNSFNKFGQNSLYISCKNGNLEVIKFLLDQQANPFIKSKVYENFYESPLEVSIRWNHYHCVQLLLEKSNYSNKELKAAIRQTTNPQIKQLIKSNLKADTLCCF
ncbi:unnamed protein product [Paramecium pentaurelia]|uniref:Ankyrin repeat protein n=1 Tax=Paramecium pentaurelia TaxID=43138 RepID=A0A8S1UIN0_9CILI|nr:unnamed protein product [Paramecium pentaurelia]